MNTCFAMILALVMTWTAESKNSVVPSGDVPANTTAQYTNSYAKNQLTAGNTAVLTLSGLAGITINKIEIAMRSNKESGAGVITVAADEHTIASLAGTYKQWTGAFDNSQYRSLSVFDGECKDVSALAITVECTTSSLYIDRFTVTYTPAPARTVTLMLSNEVYATLEEQQSGAGVYLPSLEPYNELTFVGWAQSPFWTVYALPSYIPSGLYYPSSDIVLWSVWAYPRQVDTTYLADLQSGEYIYTNRENGRTLSGIPSDDGRMASVSFNMDDPDQVYAIEFLAPDTAMIRHKRTNTPIGYTGSKLAARETPWLVYHEDDQTLFYTTVAGKNYILWLNILNSGESAFYAGLLEATVGASPVGLRKPRPADDKPAYTCHPESPQAITTVHPDAQEQIIPVGIYELHICNGRKYIQLRQ